MEYVFFPASFVKTKNKYSTFQLSTPSCILKKKTQQVKRSYFKSDEVSFIYMAPVKEKSASLTIFPLFPFNQNSQQADFIY